MTEWHPYHVMAARTWRFFDRYLKAREVDAFANDGIAYNDAEDSLHACFQCCWHIKDWIANDKSLTSEVHTSIDAAAHADQHLRIIQGFANGTKHLELTGRWGQKQLKVDDAEVELLERPDGGVSLRLFLHIRETNTRIAADDAIRLGMIAWARILDGHGLSFPVDHPHP